MRSEIPIFFPGVPVPKPICVCTETLLSNVITHQEYSLGQYQPFFKIARYRYTVYPNVTVMEGPSVRHAVNVVYDR